MTLEKQIKEKYQETCEKRDAIQKEVDLNKVGEVVISILEIFQETVRGKLIGKIFIMAILMTLISTKFIINWLKNTI